jgi:Xaa-Pro aminopeptidase
MLNREELPMPIAQTEYQSRQRTFAHRLREAELDGAVVVSRGGGTYDRFANVYYLTGHYQPYVYLPNQPPLWSGRSHTVLVLSAAGEGILCVSVPEYFEERICADEIRYSGDFGATVAGAIASLGLDRARLNLVGSDVLPTELWQQLCSQVDVSWAFGDERLEELRLIKSHAEQELIRSVSATARWAYSAFLNALEPGCTEAEAVAAAAEIVVSEGATLVYAACSSGPHTWAWTGWPLHGYSTRRLEAGDLVRLDLMTIRDGYLSDFGRTAVVGQPTGEQQRLLETLYAGLDAAIDAIGPGVPVREVVAAGDAALRAMGVQMEPGEGAASIRAGYPAHWGHGLGLAFERPWLVDSEEILLQAGMYLAVERALEMENVGSAAAEQNLLVTVSGAECLTAGPEGRWS